MIISKIEKDYIAAIAIDNIEELKYFRKTLDKLSNKKLQELLKKYEEYHNSNVLDEKRIVHMNKEEILKLNEEILIKS